ncbi:MAG: helix-turn-helix domain-containing protein [Hydrotalea sp.]|nr:helix-turn-helix domain-containing protein [Hydrotalea sp.]
MKLDELGLILEQRREKLQLRQADLSEMSGVNVRTIIQLEKGQGNPSFITLEKLLNILGLEIGVELKKTSE